MSVLLGLGLASLFRVSCNDESCIEFRGPHLNMIENKIYKYDERCYKYTLHPTKCNATKRKIPLSTPVADQMAPASAPVAL